ncbi:hypothetical protein JCM10213_005306 [Rhodosporidiobolus nylandii]
MADQRGNDNPFDQPYPPATASASPLPRLVIPDPSPPHSANPPPGDEPLRQSVTASDDPADQTASSHTMLNTSQGTHRSTSSAGRRVQWPAELPAGSRDPNGHVAIDMAAVSPNVARNMASPGAQDELTRALEAHTATHGTDDEDEDDYDRNPRYIGTEGTPSRAASSDGDPDERLEALKDDMDVFVDPGETAGLPSARRRNPEETSAKAAWGLVRGLTQAGQLGSAPGIRRRKTNGGRGGFTSGQGLNREESPQSPGSGNAEDGQKNDQEGENEQRSGLSGFLSRIKEGNVQDIPPETQFSSVGGGGGILSALIALQQQQAQQRGGDSTTVSGATTPTSMGPSTRANSIMDGDFSDEEEEEAERLKFLAKLHEKRARQGNLGRVAGAVSSGAQGIAVGAGRGAGAVIGTAGRGAGAVIGTAGKGAGAVLGTAGKGANAVVGLAGKASGLNSKSHSKQPSAEGTPATGEVGEAKQKKDKKGIFDRVGSAVGLELSERERPDAARSGAGVFGGLIAGANNLAGAASPGGTTLAPDPTRPGYHISRYSQGDDMSRSRSGSVEQSPELGRSTASTAAGSAPSTPTFGGNELVTTPGKEHKRNVFSLSLGNLSNLPAHGASKLGLPPGASPRKELGEYFSKETEEEMDRRAWEKEKRRRRKAKEKRKAQEVFITQHVAAILERQNFVMKMARAFMMFGAPSHRLEAQMQATARVLEINCQVIYIPGVMLISFGDVATHTSDIKFLKQANGLDLGKLLTAYMIYFNVIHDKISVTEASVQLDDLMISPPKYKLWQQLIIGACASAFIQPSAFYGSFIDCLMSMPLGALLVLVQVIVSRNDLYSSLFEIVIACIIAFLAAALASTKYFCFAAVVSGSVVLILPGYIVLCGSLELANRSIISGSVRLVYAILYSLFLGFGLTIGSEIYARITSLTIYGSTDYTCGALRGDGVPWYMNTIPQKWYILTIPMFLLCLALRNGQPLFRRETLVMLVVGSAGFVSNFFSGKAFINRSDISSAIGSFAVGFLGNLYGKFTRGSPFVVMVPGVLIQLPSGLSNGGLLKFADADSSDTYSSGFATAESLVEVAIGLTVGLFVSAAIVNVLGGGRRRGSNLSSF